MGSGWGVEFGREPGLRGGGCGAETLKRRMWRAVCQNRPSLPGTHRHTQIHGLLRHNPPFPESRTQNWPPALSHSLIHGLCRLPGLSWA